MEFQSLVKEKKKFPNKIFYIYKGKIIIKCNNIIITK